MPAWYDFMEKVGHAPEWPYPILYEQEREIETDVLVLGGGIAVALVLLIWIVLTYNRFVQLRRHIQESWADIDVELKRRYELIPNLVATVKGYAEYERESIEQVVELRAKAGSKLLHYSSGIAVVREILGPYVCRMPYVVLGLG